MNYKKQLKAIEEHLNRCEAKLQELSSPTEFTTPPHVCDWQLEDMTIELGFLIAAAYEGNNLRDLAKRALLEFENLPHKDYGEENTIISPRLNKAWTYYRALNLIIIPSTVDKFERTIKIMATIIGLLAGLGGLWKINHEIRNIQLLIQDTKQPLSEK